MTLLIYVAGPYTAKTAWGIEQNIHAARAMGVLIAKHGAYPVIPHSNTGGFHGEAPEEMFYAGTLELMRRCDGVAFLDNWKMSAGARAEYEEAGKLGRPVWSPTGFLGKLVPLSDWLASVAAHWAAKP